MYPNSFCNLAISRAHERYMKSNKTMFISEWKSIFCVQYGKLKTNSQPRCACELKWWGNS
ncbi:hypothetical protein BDD12DRAFT_860892 [Trichophaea hybrida]|nr:hypothetical protein BDD12DRAFT_860892 [Trichophaea hybrida]